LSFNSKELGLTYYNSLVNKNKSVCSRIYKYLQNFIYLFIDKLHETVIYFLSIRYYRSSLAGSINLPKKKFLDTFISRKIIVFFPSYFFYIIITILLFHDFIKVRVMSMIRVFGTSITGLIIIITHNINNKRGSSLVLFYDLLKI
jgi:hypothetical protein